MNPFLTQMQNWIAYTSVGPSTLRGYKSGLAILLKRELCQVDLCALAAGTASRFSTWLNKETERLERKIEEEQYGPGYWGPARKVLNIFLRGSTYNSFLREAFGLDQFEPVLELPLDSLSAKGLRQASKNGATALPRWPGVKYLTPQVSEQYQHRATAIAASRSVHRVHLDIVYYVRDM